MFDNSNIMVHIFTTAPYDHITFLNNLHSDSQDSKPLTAHLGFFTINRRVIPFIIANSILKCLILTIL